MNKKDFENGLIDYINDNYQENSVRIIDDVLFLDIYNWHFRLNLNGYLKSTGYPNCLIDFKEKTANVFYDEVGKIIDNDFLSQIKKC